MKKLEVALIGEPNTGKSSFLNSIIGEKISIVSPLIQTTRQEIYGIYNENDYQIIFTDTPGLNIKYKETETIGNKVVKNSDLVIFFFSTDQPIKDFILDKALFCKTKKIAIINKVDKYKRSKVLLMTNKIKHIFSTVFYISSKTKEGLNDVINYLKEHCYENDNVFSKDFKFTQEKTQIEELVREVVYNKFYEEVPYSAKFNLDKIEKNKIYFTITAPNRHRRIYLSKIKEISRNSRLSINKNLKINIHFFLKIKFI